MNIYKITNINNNKIYIGQTKNTIQYRFKQHFRSAIFAKNNNRPLTYFQNALLKYGIKSFIVELIETVQSKEEADIQEIYWIKFYKATNKQYGYNSANGGANMVSNLETRNKISQKAKARWSDQQYRSKMKQSMLEREKRKREERQQWTYCHRCGLIFPYSNQKEHTKYCSRKCRYKSAQYYHKGLEAMITKNTEYRIERYHLIKEIAEEWAIENKSVVEEAKMNKISTVLQPLVDLIYTTVGVKDWRVISKAVSNTNSRKMTLTYLQNYVKMYAVPD